MDYLCKQESVSICATGMKHLNCPFEKVAYVTANLGGKMIDHFQLNWLVPVNYRNGNMLAPEPGFRVPEMRHRARGLALWVVLVLMGCATLAGCGGGSVNSDSNSKPSSGTSTPQLVATPASIDFGTVTMGTNATQSITISNPGTAGVTISQASTSVTTFSTNGLTLPLAIAPGQKSTFSVEFAPTVAGAVSGQLSLVNNSATSPVVLSLTGTGGSGTPLTFSISGTVSNSAGVSLMISGAASATTTADGSGKYSFTGLTNGSYSVTPTKAGFSFTPSSHDVTVTGANVAGVNFTGTPAGGIQGNISPALAASGATLTLSQGTSTIATASADSNGNYTFSALVNGAYTVTPAKNGYSFTPSSQSVTVGGAPVTGVNFTALAGLAIDAVAVGDSSSASTSAVTSAFSTTSANQLLLAFIATDASSPGMTVTGVTGGRLTWALVRRTNAQMGTAELWSAFASSSLGNLSVTATLSQSVVSSITVVSFTGTDSSGSNGSGAIGATAGASASSGAPTATLVTTRNGSWVFGVGNDWDTATARTPAANQTIVHQLLSASGDTYWVQKQNNTTASSGTSVAINDTAPTSDRYNLTVVEVLPPGTTSVASHSISGSISPAAQGSGATVTLSGAGNATTTADGSGNYAFSGLANGSYTVTPTKSGISFTPASQAVTVNGASVTAVNFAVQTWSISGNLSPASNSAGATLTLGGAGSGMTTADSSGNYSFGGLTNGTYAVTPSKSGFSFSPSAQSSTINGASVAGVNFTLSVISGVTVSISPTSASIATGGTQPFSATVTGTTNSAVTWSANGGSVSSSGLYTAPGTPGTYTVTATSVADSTKSATATVNVTSATTSDVLLGDQSVENQTNSIAAGQAEAFQATAKATGNVKSLVLYLDASSTLSQLVAGLYADAGGHPGALLGQGSSTSVVKGAWNPVTLPSTNLVGGTPYWIAILGTGSGTLAFRVSSGGGCNAETGSQSSLTSLPANWSSGAMSSNCPVSVFGANSIVVFFDDFPGTSLSPFWTIINRHGEYSQNEAECNIPQQVSVANGLTITTAAQNSVCGDFHPDGTVWHTPSSWPYITGDIQWTNLNFTFGSIEIRAKFSDQRTSLWPATWLLGSNCQSTNPFTGETGVGDCPSLGSDGYTEIDMTECYGSGWCQFHVADPNFGIGNGCDAVYVVDTNWHTFTTVWNSSGITQYMDEVAETTCGQQLTNPMFLLIQTQTGGAGGTPNNDFLPATLEVDYVKVTQP